MYPLRLVPRSEQGLREALDDFVRSRKGSTLGRSNIPKQRTDRRESAGEAKR
jgi:hypothetical protein